MQKTELSLTALESDCLTEAVRQLSLTASVTQN